MENKAVTHNDNKFINKVRSFNNPSVVRGNDRPCKRKSFNVNDAVKSLDLALGRLKKSKLVNDEGRQSTPDIQGTSEIFMDIPNSSQHFNQGISTSSLMSLSFSNYDLLRNLSRSNCNSDGAFSDNTNHCVTNIDGKDEHLERYFRSIEMWSKGHREIGPSADSPDKTSTQNEL